MVVSLRRREVIFGAEEEVLQTWFRRCSCECGSVNRVLLRVWEGDVECSGGIMSLAGWIAG